MARSDLAILLCLGSETYGRYHESCHILIRQLARHKTRDHQEFLQSSAKHAYMSRWWSLPSMSIQKLVSDGCLSERGWDIAGDTDDRHDYLDEVLDFHGR